MQLRISGRDLPPHLRKYFRPVGHKPKDLVNIPSLVAEALREDGWYLRSDIAWCKSASMPESVRDRPSSAWEHVFLLTRSQRYFYDADAVRQPYSEMTTDTAQRQRMIAQGKFSTEDEFAGRATGQRGGVGERMFHLDGSGAKLRNWWLLGPEPLSLDHYAAYPTELVRRCVLAGSSERGVCPVCNAPWVRVVERTAMVIDRSARRERMGEFGRTQSSGTMVQAPTAKTVGWQPSCTCHAGEPMPSLILDPFSGSGTTGIVALRHGRRYLGLELNPSYVTMSERRITGDAPLFNTPTAPAPDGLAQLALEGEWR
jgi:DNA methylase